MFSFWEKCGGLKKTTEIGHFILPTAAIRGEGTSDDYFPKEVPAMPSFKLHKPVSELLVEKDMEYQTGVVYSKTRIEEFGNTTKSLKNTFGEFVLWVLIWKLQPYLLLDLQTRLIEVPYY